MKVHRGICHLYCAKFGLDPRAQKNETQKALYNPIKLAAGWFQNVERYLLAGETVLVNSSGGFMLMGGTTILETIESGDLHWDDRFDTETITIHKWPKGKHWYLTSNKNRVFIPEKHGSLTAARKAALRFVPADRIETKENAGALPPE